MITNRSQQKELLDLGPDFYTQDEYQDALQKLFQINRLFGFLSSTKKVLKQFPEVSTLIDIGCGGGLFLLHLQKRFPQIGMLGIDINPDAITLAQAELDRWKKEGAALNLSFASQSAAEVFIQSRYDAILATLVCHHLSDEELIEFLQNAYENANRLVLINDVQRHVLSYHSYAWLSPFLFANRLITHDGLISIQRGFTRKEWQRLFAKANIKQYQIKWCWPFRWQIILRKN
ncbi:methyltransferase [Legionella jordanis]|uniref:Methyltransferase n=1 Tax=Legionella jordanis TaxID=456 RepID=A0A0W0VCQ0_9GAMM|nr:methyltransferase [Legionella jordanis]KTD17882.1 methyltransferase [Legionella jordanis]VEH14027.1 methyltransferase [Legionella jordanis]